MIFQEKDLPLTEIANNVMSWVHCTACEDKDISAVPFLIILARILSYTLLKQKLSKINLGLVASNGDDPIRRPWKRIIDLDVCTTTLSVKKKQTNKQVSCKQSTHGHTGEQKCLTLFVEFFHLLFQ